MASWSEQSSYQGAAAGATAGSVGGVYGAAAGAVVGFVAGGLIGGSQQDAARKAEEDRQKEIQRAIDRQNTADFTAKAQAEHWAMSDIGINKDDQLQDARAETEGLKKNVSSSETAVSKAMNAYKAVDGSKKITTDNWAANKAQYEKWGGKNNLKYVKSVEDAIISSKISKNALTANEGIIANYEKEMGAPNRY